MKPKGLFILSPIKFELIYPKDIYKQIESLVDIYAPVMSSEQVSENIHILQDAQFLFSGWGCPSLDEDFLVQAKKLQVVFYGAGSIKNIITDSFWDRKIRITSAASANGIPVAQYILSQVLFSLKSGWRHVRTLRKTHCWQKLQDTPGIFNNSNVGIISLGIIGKLVAEYLAPFEVNVFAYDPYVNDWPGVKMKSLEELFAECDVIACCTPNTPQTAGMLGCKHFQIMKPEASFINAARGAVINEDDMIKVLQKRNDLTAVLDVTNPEPPKPDSPLWTMENIILTPHIAGSMGSECSRMGTLMLEELRLYLQDDSLQYEVTQDKLKGMA